MIVEAPRMQIEQLMFSPYFVLIATHLHYCEIFKSFIMCVLSKFFFLTHNYSTDFSALQILMFDYSK